MNKSDVIKCSSCGHSLKKSAKFCENCGTPTTQNASKKSEKQQSSVNYTPLFIILIVALLVAGYYNLKLLSKGKKSETIQQNQTSSKVPDDAVHSGVTPPLMDENVLKAKKIKVKNEPQNVAAIIDLANYLHDHQQYMEAIKFYDQAIQLNPKPEYIVDAGVSYFNMGNLEKAREYFAQALNENPNHPKALFNLGVVYYNQQKMSELKKVWSKLVSNVPTSPEAREAKKFLDQIKKSGNSD